MLSYRGNGRRDEAEERQLNLQEALATETAGLADSYCALCTSLQVVPHSGVLAFIRLRLAELRPLEREGFADRDMFAFCDFMLRDGAAMLQSLTTAGAMASRQASTGAPAAVAAAPATAAAPALAPAATRAPAAAAAK